MAFGSKTCLLALICISGTQWLAAAETRSASANRMLEISFHSDEDRADPFNAVDLDVVFTTPDAKIIRVPAFWAGGRTWRVRYASPTVGQHRYRTECSIPSDAGLHSVEGEVTVTPYIGENPLYKHGSIRVAPDRRHFEHLDGTPFLWLGDTWWMGLSERLHWPDEFRTLAADRSNKGYNVVQIVAGLYPDMAAFDDRGRNEAGFPWEKDYGSIRSEYFDLADRRLQYLADQGIVPCIVGAWGYHLPWMGAEKMRKHWRYVIARYGALPVVWCVAGEVNLPYYLNERFPRGGEQQTADWEEIIRYVQDLNGFDRMVTVHPTGLPPLSGRLLYTDQKLLDFDMLQTGHGMREVLKPSIDALRASLAAKPPMPVVNSEVAYEALLDGKITADVPRLIYWASMLSGAAGHTYGANGIWQVNREDQAYGASPHGGNYGTIPWNESMHLPGSGQLALGKRLFEQYAWEEFEPHADWASWEQRDLTPVTWSDWIWFPEGEPATHAPLAARYFRKTFRLPEGAQVARAVLRVTADDSFVVFLNGAKIGASADWHTVQEYSRIAEHLRPGENVLAVRAENLNSAVDRNPAGLLCSLDVALSNNGMIAVRTDASWRSSRKEAEDWTTARFDDAVWKPAKIAAHYGDAPWGEQARLGEEPPAPFAAGVPGRVRIIYMPSSNPVVVLGLEADVQYAASVMDPISGKRLPIGMSRRDVQGTWTVSPPDGIHSDWVLILDARPGNTGQGKAP